MSDELDFLFGFTGRDLSSDKKDTKTTESAPDKDTPARDEACEVAGDVPRDVQPAEPDSPTGRDGDQPAPEGSGDGGETANLSSAASALGTMSQAQIGRLFRTLKTEAGVQDMPSPNGQLQSDDRGGDDRGAGDNVLDEGVDVEAGGVDRMHLLSRRDGAGTPVQTVPSVEAGHSEARQTKGSNEAEHASPRVQRVFEGSEVFFPTPTGELTGQIQRAPWELRKSSTIEHKFPWAEGITDEQKETYELQLQGVIARMGAKSKLRDFLIERFPSHHTYVEPFGGSFKVLLWKAKRSKIEIINDIDADLIHFFRYVTFFPEQIADLVNSLPTHKGLLDALRDELKRGDLGGLERAAAVYYSIKLSFNGTGLGYAGSVQSLASARADKGEFRRVADRLRGVDIRSQDAHDLIRLCNKRLDPDRYPGGIFFYLDPPYDETAGYATLNSQSIYGKQEQYALFNLAREIHGAGNRFIMTNSFTEYLQNMWCKEDGWHFVKRMVKYDISGKAEARKETAELIVANFPLVKQGTNKAQGGLF